MKKKQIQSNKLTSEQRAQRRKELADNFPTNGNARAEQNAAFLGVCVSAFWSYVASGRIKKPVKYGNRVSVWDVTYIREIQKNGF